MNALEEKSPKANHTRELPEWLTEQINFTPLFVPFLIMAQQHRERERVGP